MIVVDTNVFIAYHNEGDQHHKRAQILLNEIKNGNYGEAYITDYIFNECATILAARIKNRDESVKRCEKIKLFPMLKIDEFTFENSWEQFKAQTKLLLSFTDCTIVVIMKKYNIQYLATFDTDFNNIQDITVMN